MCRIHIEHNLKLQWSTVFFLRETYLILFFFSLVFHTQSLNFVYLPNLRRCDRIKHCISLDSIGFIDIVRMYLRARVCMCDILCISFSLKCLLVFSLFKLCNILRDEIFQFLHATKKHHTAHVYINHFKFAVKYLVSSRFYSRRI